MAPSKTPVHIDPADEARQLATLFDNLSLALDDFRLNDHDPPLSSKDAARLKKEADALEDLSHYFTAQAIGATLQKIQPDLENIKALTKEAKEQVAKLNEISKVFTIAGAALSLGKVIITGDPVSILASAEAFAQTVVA